MTKHDHIAHSRFYRAALWSASVALIVLGVYLSKIAFLDAEWLSRAGCLVVMLGIWSGLGGIIQERVLNTRMRWWRRNAKVQARAELEADDAHPEHVEKKLDEIDDSFDQRASHLAQELKLSVGVLEVSLLITGTFLWGFGDLLVR